MEAYPASSYGFPLCFVFIFIAIDMVSPELLLQMYNADEIGFFVLMYKPVLKNLLSTLRHILQEAADNNCVYRNEVHHSVSERTQILTDVASDPTLPRTKAVRCAKCQHGEAVFFQVKSIYLLIRLHH